MMTTNFFGLLLISLQICSRVVAEDVTIDWTIEGALALPQQIAHPGDTFTFKFVTGFHNVYIHPSGTCDADGSIEVGSSGGVSYTFTNEEAGTEVTFASQMDGHCAAGQIMTVVVEPANEFAVVERAIQVVITPTVSPSLSLMPSLSEIPSSTGMPSMIEPSVGPSAEDGPDGPGPDGPGPDGPGDDNGTRGADGLDGSSAVAYGLSVSSVVALIITALLG